MSLRDCCTFNELRRRKCDLADSKMSKMVSLAALCNFLLFGSVVLSENVDPNPLSAFSLDQCPEYPDFEVKGATRMDDESLYVFTSSWSINVNSIRRNYFP